MENPSREAVRRAQGCPAQPRSGSALPRSGLAICHVLSIDEDAGMRSGGAEAAGAAMDAAGSAAQPAASQHASRHRGGWRSVRTSKLQAGGAEEADTVGTINSPAGCQTAARYPVQTGVEIPAYAHALVRLTLRTPL